jgi:hypothetical protein
MSRLRLLSNVGLIRSNRDWLLVSWSRERFRILAAQGLQHGMDRSKQLVVLLSKGMRNFARALPGNINEFRFSVADCLRRVALLSASFAAKSARGLIARPGTFSMAALIVRSAMSAIAFSVWPAGGADW